ncbi:hypothetical protein J6590_090340, partial [Homalodisca vitripennis]
FGTLSKDSGLGVVSGPNSIDVHGIRVVPSTVTFADTFENQSYVKKVFVQNVSDRSLTIRIYNPRAWNIQPKSMGKSWVLQLTDLESYYQQSLSLTPWRIRATSIKCLCRTSQIVLSPSEYTTREHGFRVVPSTVTFIDTMENQSYVKKVFVQNISDRSLTIRIYNPRAWSYVNKVFVQNVSDRSLTIRIYNPRAWKLKLFTTLHDLDLNGQGNYLLGLIELMPIERRRHGSYEQPDESRRQHTVSYSIPDVQGQNKRVCKKVFMDIFGIKSSKRVEILVKKKKKKKMGDTIYKDKRGGIKTFKFTLADRNEVRLHIRSFPTEPTHYSRKQSDKQCLKAAYTAMKNDSEDSAKSNSDTTTIVIDLQKVFQLPRLTHSDMYYLKQLNFHNLGIHICDSVGIFYQIDHKFVVVGHSFLATDRDFALIEKRWTHCNDEVMSDIKKHTSQLHSVPPKLQEVISKIKELVQEQTPEERPVLQENTRFYHVPLFIDSFRVIPIERGYQLAPGLKIVRCMHYTCTKSGIVHSSLPIYVNDKCYHLPLEAYKGQAFVAISPTSIDFGRVDIGAKPVEKRLVIRNASSCATKFLVDLGRNELDLQVTPLKGWIRPHSSVTICLQLIPLRVGELSSEIWITTDLSQNRIQVSGEACKRSLMALHPNSTSDFTLVEFPTTFYGCRRYQTVIIYNMAASSSAFVVLVDYGNKQHIPIREAQKGKNKQIKMFHVDTEEGRIRPFEGRIITIWFQPVAPEERTTGWKSKDVEEVNDYLCAIRIKRIQVDEYGMEGAITSEPERLSPKPKFVATAKNHSIPDLDLCE